jgi:hypothetical protein
MELQRMAWCVAKQRWFRGFRFEFAAFASKWDNSVVVSSRRHLDQARENDVRGVAPPDAPLRG